MNTVFAIPQELPSHPEDIPLYRVTLYLSPSAKVKEAARDFDDRINRYKAMFSMEGEVTDQGDSKIIRDGTKVLQVYRPSDSFWWYDEEVANREITAEAAEKAAEVKLPTEEQALKKSQDYLASLGVDMTYAKVASVTRTTLKIPGGAHKSPKGVETEIHTGFSFAIDNYPIMGPGAKIRVSMVEGDRTSSVVYFWRQPQKNEAVVKAIRPDEALTWLTREPRYSQLTPDQAQITIEAMRFGYYAVAPFLFQRFLIPVYEISGVQESRLLGRQNITIYTPAIDLSPTRIKRLSFLDQLDIKRYLASTK